MSAAKERIFNLSGLLDLPGLLRFGWLPLMEVRAGVYALAAFAGGAFASGGQAAGGAR